MRLVPEHDRARTGARPLLRIWSARPRRPGEEPYSIAIALCECLRPRCAAGEIHRHRHRHAVLAGAEKGIYAHRADGQMTPERLKRFFLRGTGAQRGHARVRRELAGWSRSQLMRVKPAWTKRWPAARPVRRHLLPQRDDLFRQADPAQVLQRLARLHEPDGLLFAGHSESLLDSGRPRSACAARPSTSSARARHAAMNREDVLSDEPAEPLLRSALRDRRGARSCRASTTSRPRTWCSSRCSAPASRPACATASPASAE